MSGLERFEAQGFLIIVEDILALCICITGHSQNPHKPKELRRLRGDVGGLGKGIAHFGFHVQSTELGVKHLLLPDGTSRNPNLGCGKTLTYCPISLFYDAIRCNKSDIMPVLLS